MLKYYSMRSLLHAAVHIVAKKDVCRGNIRLDRQAPQHLFKSTVISPNKALNPRTLMCFSHKHRISCFCCSYSCNRKVHMKLTLNYFIIMRPKAWIAVLYGLLFNHWAVNPSRSEKHPFEQLMRFLHGAAGSDCVYTATTNSAFTACSKSVCAFLYIAVAKCIEVSADSPDHVQELWCLILISVWCRCWSESIPDSDQHLRGMQSSSSLADVVLSIQLVAQS